MAWVRCDRTRGLRSCHPSVVLEERTCGESLPAQGTLVISTVGSKRDSFVLKRGPRTHCAGHQGSNPQILAGVFSVGLEMAQRAMMRDSRAMLDD